MTSVETVNVQIISKIMAAFPNIPFTAQEKLEEIARPAFKLILDEIKSKRYTSEYAQRTYPVELAYFAADKERPKIECLALYEQLEPVLYGMTDEIASTLVSSDAVLVMEFGVTDTVSIPAVDSSSGENIETLNLMEELN